MLPFLSSTARLSIPLPSSIYDGDVFVVSSTHLFNISEYQVPAGSETLEVTLIFFT